MCFEPGNEEAERRLVRYTLDSYQPLFRCEGAIVYRLAAPTADHYFLINDGPARSVHLDTSGFVYRSATDALTGEPLSLGAPIELEAYSGRWLRLEKAP